MKQLHVAITGVTSFTGAWIADGLARAGFQVSGLCTRRPMDYKGLQAERLKILAAAGVQLHAGLKAEDQSYCLWIKQRRPDVWIHHHHFMENFRSPHYDMQASETVGIQPLPNLVEALKSSGCKKVIFSGSYFEPGEGGPFSQSSVTPYANSKAKVWSGLSELCRNAALPIAKIVIPNPIGPLENDDRLIPILIQKSKDRSPLILTTPNSTAVNLPVSILAKTYVMLIEDEHSAQGLVLRPSIAAESNLAFVNRVREHLISERLNIEPCAVQLPEIESSFTHRENGKEKPVTHFDWPKFWDNYAHVILKTSQGRSHVL